MTRSKAVTLGIIFIATSTYLIAIHRENIYTDSTMKFVNVSSSWRNVSKSRIHTHESYNTSDTGRTNHASTIKRPYNASITDISYNASNTGRTNHASTIRRPYNASITDISYNASTAGRGPQIRRLPRALILGFDKAGTDTLRDMLLMNPKIVAPKEEINYFKNYLAKGVEWYRNQMPLSYEDQITMEKSIYIRERNVPYKIKDFDPNMKLMIIVREPVVRLISDYLDQKRKSPGIIPSTFEKWVCYDCKQFKNVVERSIYSIHYQQYLKSFPKDQIYIVDGDKLKEEPYPIIKETEKFLGVDSAITQDNFYFNETKGFWCMSSDIDNQRGCQGPLKGRKQPYVNPELIVGLRKYYHPYNLAFYKLAGRDFGWPEY